MAKTNLFYTEQCVSMPGKVIIKVNADILGCGLKEMGSWSVLPARILGISYVDWLRFTRDEFGATLVGKNCLYVVPYFDNNDITSELVKLLNNKFGLIKIDYAALNKE